MTEFLGEQIKRLHLFLSKSYNECQISYISSHTLKSMFIYYHSKHLFIFLCFGKKSLKLTVAAFI